VRLTKTWVATGRQTGYEPHFISLAKIGSEEGGSLVGGTDSGGEGNIYMQQARQRWGSVGGSELPSSPTSARTAAPEIVTAVGQLQRAQLHAICDLARGYSCAS
jgi:hypothetical protein